MSQPQIAVRAFSLASCTYKRPEIRHLRRCQRDGTPIEPARGRYGEIEHGRPGTGDGALVDVRRSRRFQAVERPSDGELVPVSTAVTDPDPLMVAIIVRSIGTGDSRVLNVRGLRAPRRTHQ